ncbi:hypothetical protein VQ056_15485 [Paenibacillus sp. JTLBN-2024]
MPAVQAGYSGAMLGIIGLTLRRLDGKWQAVHGKAMVREICDGMVGSEFAEPDAEIAALLQQAHQQTVAYANAPIGRTEVPLHTYFSLVHADASVQLLNHAQRDYARRWIASVCAGSAASPRACGLVAVQSRTERPERLCGDSARTDCHPQRFGAVFVRKYRQSRQSLSRSRPERMA